MRTSCRVCSCTEEVLAYRDRCGWECSHVDCPKRRKAWSERPQPGYKPPEKVLDPMDRMFDNPNDPKEE